MKDRGRAHQLTHLHPLGRRQPHVLHLCDQWSALSSDPRMERVQNITRSAIRRASNIEVNPQTKRNLQELFINFSLILICLLLIYIIVLLL
ncbi:hypothetical protein MHYP_G00131730 [Metynnis hypsauchen]